MIIGLLGTANGVDSEATTAIFWAMVGLPVLLIMPLSGLGALSNEKAANTLELIFLTRLSAWRIVLGKWFAIVAQIALFTCAVLPYAVLRYFMGGVNLTDNLVGLAFILTSSAVLTAIAVGISPFQTRVTRVISILGIIFLLQFIVPYTLFLIFDGGVMSGGRTAGRGWQSGLAGLLFSALTIVLMLQVAAAKIAPPAENHSAIKRGIGVAFLAFAAVLVFLGADPHLAVLGAVFCSLPVLIGAVCDPVRWNQNVYRPFVRFGFPGRLLGRLFYPGWPSGVLFAIVLMLGFGVLLFATKVIDSERLMLVYLAGLGLILFPAAVTRLFFRRTENPLAFFAGAIAICAMFTILASILDSIFNSGFRILLSVLPPAAFLESAMPILKDDEIGRATMLCAIGDLVSVLLLLVLMLPAWKRIRAVEQRIAASAVAPVAAHEPLA